MKLSLGSLAEVKSVLCMLSALLSITLHSFAYSQAPDATFTGPVMAEDYPSRNSIYSGTAMDLAANAYVEEEYFFEGRAKRYNTVEMDDATVIDEGHRYKSRIVVRRPANAEDFNGIVVVEWNNVTGGPDKDIDWWQSGHHFMRNGYGFIAVTAQQMGIESMKEFSPSRYDSLDATHDGMVSRDGLSFDIFSAVGKAINRIGEDTPSGSVDFMGGLKAQVILATGHSQSASRLAVYLNNIHPLEPVYDGVMVHGGGGRIRDDQDVKIFKIMAETDMPRRAATPQPNSETFRQWEVAGSSHVDIPFEIEWARVRALQAGTPLELAAPRSQECDLEPYSRVPFRDVMNAAFEHLVSWVRDDQPPPIAQALQVARMLPELEFARDEHGNVLGGIRLAEHVVAKATNTGMNAGTNGFCRLYGSHDPFDQALLESLYPTHAAYVDAVRAVVEQNLADGFILPYAAERTIREAEASSIGR